MGQEGLTTVMPTAIMSHCGDSRNTKTFPERRKSTCTLAQETFVSCINNGDGEQLVPHCDPSHGRLTDFLRHLKCSGYGKLSETCGLSISELEAMAARQARQLETQEQLLAAKAQRLRFLKSSGEAERLQRLREKVASQEERLRKLRALRGKVQTNRNGNSVLSADLESLRSGFNEKEKELSMAVAKVEELTRQLEDLRRSPKEQSQNGQSAAAMELEKLKRELLYRHKLRESQSTRVLNQKQTLSQKQDETMRVDRRIAELQERLHRKRIQNSQLAASLKHQDNEEDFLTLPNKNDPKYQTLPYNAKLFTPFTTNPEQEQFEKSMQQMQIINQPPSQHQSQSAATALQFQVRQYRQQQQQSNQYSNQVNNGNNNAAIKDVPTANYTNATSNNERIQSYNNKNNLHINQLQNFLSHQQNNQNTPKSAITASCVPMITATNGPQVVQQANNTQVLRGKVDNEAVVRPNSFLPTGAPSCSLNNTCSPSSASTLGGNMQQNGFNTGQISGTTLGYDDCSHLSSDSERQLKPALPPKPSKPTPPPRQAMDFTFGLGSRLHSSSDEIMMPDRTELPIKSNPLFPKNLQNAIVSTGSSFNVVSTSSSSSSTTEKEPSSTCSTNSTVRVSMNRRIEMPPAFLFPESDPPPSDLVPEHSSSSQSSLNTLSTSSIDNNCGGPSSNQNQLQTSSQHTDSTDASTLIHQQHQNIIEEYTLPDLFPNPPQVNNFLSPSTNNKENQAFNNNQHFNDTHSDMEQDETQANSGGPDNETQNHIALMNNFVGPESPKGFEDGNHVPTTTNNQGQLDKFEADADNYDEVGDGGEESPEEEEHNPVDSSINVPGVLRRLKKSNFKSSKRDHIPLGRRVSFDPLALLLDASLEGELDLVMKTASEVGNVSAANDEGITALHNAICAGHAEVVRFLVEFGCDVNAQDSDGWTPLHCAASCNNVGMVKFLVEHGACIFATTLSDHETAAEKCEEDEDGFGPCSEYLYSIQEKLGIMNNGVVYAVFEYDAQNQDELTFHNGERLVILRKGDEYEREWWWAAAAEKQGYVPRNLLGLYPRVVPHQRNGDS